MSGGWPRRRTTWTASRTWCRAALPGCTCGARCKAEVDLAEAVRKRMPAVEMVRFVNSGTEATMAALRVARAATRRELVLKFEGCYHGHADSFLVKAGSGVATLGLPDSPGVPAALAGLTLTLPFNDTRALGELFRRRGDTLAAVIVEPYVGNCGFIAPEPEFHTALRARSEEHTSELQSRLHLVCRLLLEKKQQPRLGGSRAFEGVGP